MLFEGEESWAEAALGLGGFGTYDYLFDLFRCGIIPTLPPFPK
jgi:hypothetical protein